jgi:glycosyltransferase involved in cell wall biosynthesis
MPVRSDAASGTPVETRDAALVSGQPPEIAQTLALLSSLQGDDIRLLVPEHDLADPEISIVIPALNEEVTISEFVGWCQTGLANAGVRGEILIVDSSHDSTPQKALAAGARVLRTPKRGLGRAYIDAIPFIRGKYVLLGDADLTYDFREIQPFLDKFRQGFEFIMGSRFSGTIEDGAMPPLHRYFGTPVTNWMLNFLYSARFSDIHCGMRGITRAALVDMDLQSQEWEYASETIIKSIHMGLRTSEVPIHFYKDRQGRLSHHRRGNPFSSWYAGWVNLRAFFVHDATFFLYKPGLVLLALGLLLTVPLAAGPVTVGPITFSLHWLLLGITVSILGLQSTFMGILAKCLYDYSGAQTRRWAAVFSYTRSVALSAAIFSAGLLLQLPLVRDYIRFNFRLEWVSQPRYHTAIEGLWLVMTSFLLFTMTLLVHALDKTRRWQR